MVGVMMVGCVDGVLEWIWGVGCYMSLVAGIMFERGGGVSEVN